MVSLLDGSFSRAVTCRVRYMAALRSDVQQGIHRKAAQNACPLDMFPQHRGQTSTPVQHWHVPDL